MNQISLCRPFVDLRAVTKLLATGTAKITSYFRQHLFTNSVIHGAGYIQKYVKKETHGFIYVITRRAIILGASLRSTDTGTH